MTLDLHVGWLHVHVQLGPPDDDEPMRESAVDALVERAEQPFGFTPYPEEDHR